MSGSKSVIHPSSRSAPSSDGANVWRSHSTVSPVASSSRVPSSAGARASSGMPGHLSALVAMRRILTGVYSRGRGPQRPMPRGPPARAVQSLQRTEVPGATRTGPADVHAHAAALREPRALIDARPYYFDAHGHHIAPRVRGKPRDAALERSRQPSLFIFPSGKMRMFHPLSSRLFVYSRLSRTPAPSRSNG